MVSIGKPGIGGKESVEYEATYVVGVFTVRGPVMASPVPFVHPEKM